MIRRHVKRWIVFSLVLVILTITGCSPTANKRKFDSLAIVLGVGIDYDSSKDNVLLTTQIVKTEEFEGGKRFFNITQAGKSMLEAVSNADNEANRVLYVAHNQIVVIGRQAAEKGIFDYMDYFFRDDEARYDVGMVMTEMKAGEILDKATNLGSIPSQEITVLLENQVTMSACPRLELLEFAMEANSTFKASVMPIIGISQKNPETEKVQFEVTGSGVFNDGKLIYTMNRDETRGYLWGIGEINKGEIMLSDVNVDILESSTNFEARIEGNSEKKLILTFDIDVEGNLGEVAKPKEQNTEELREISKACEELITDQLSHVLIQSFENGCDIFGASDYLFRHKYKKWKRVENNWQMLYKNATFEIKVKANIIRTGSLIEPIFGSEK